jgi:endonuclease/exonuclease/phosphatase family metal-dependent hydrolase
VLGAAPASAEPLSVMTFNVWDGGVQVDFHQIGTAIRRADADIVGVQEPEGNLRRIARSAGLPYVDESLDDGYKLLARTSFRVAR